MALTKITGKDFKEAVDWLLKEKQGCVHQVLGRTDEGTELCLVIGWADIGYDLEEVKKNGYEDEGYYICSKIGYQHRNNGMQSDFEWDFPMPYNPETGDVWDTDTYVAKGDEQSWQTDADMYNKEAEKIWATWGVPNEDGQTTLDIMESKKPSEAKKHTCSMQKKKESLAKKNEETYDRPVTLYVTTRYDDAEESQKFLDSIGGGEVKVSKERNGDTLSVSIEGADEDIDAFLAVYKDNYANLEKDCDADVMGWTDPVDLKYYTAQGRKELTGESCKSEAKKPVCSMQNKKESLLKK